MLDEEKKTNFLTTVVIVVVVNKVPIPYLYNILSTCEHEFHFPYTYNTVPFGIIFQDFLFQIA